MSNNPLLIGSIGDGETLTPAHFTPPTQPADPQPILTKTPRWKGPDKLPPEIKTNTEIINFLYNLRYEHPANKPSESFIHDVFSRLDLTKNDNEADTPLGFDTLSPFPEEGYSILQEALDKLVYNSQSMKWNRTDSFIDEAHSPVKLGDKLSLKQSIRFLVKSTDINDYSFEYSAVGDKPRILTIIKDNKLYLLFLTGAMAASCNINTFRVLYDYINDIRVIKLSYEVMKHSFARDIIFALLDVKKRFNLGRGPLGPIELYEYQKNILAKQIDFGHEQLLFTESNYSTMFDLLLSEENGFIGKIKQISYQMRYEYDIGTDLQAKGILIYKPWISYFQCGVQDYTLRNLTHKDTRILNRVHGAVGVCIDLSEPGDKKKTIADLNDHRVNVEL